MPLAEHKIHLVGFAGVILGLIVVGGTLFVIGFATTGWASVTVSDGTSVQTWNVGLWEVCQCQRPAEQFLYFDSAWYRAAQTMITFALLCLIVAFIFILMYFFFNRPSKTIMLAVITGCTFGAVLLMIINLSIFGGKMNPGQIKNNMAADGRLDWSFGVIVVSSFVCLAAGVMAVLQMSRSHGYPCWD